ncbi:hypothetical protein jhhlp_005643 [Lomentospora prolificans]|uniref:Uncharacterized protein n=1 Tax=Lomentospora prolificans TaxID=41688 RepID=A0A2N3N3N2_9PEZI|nr:hypothetical protein jhhlp_005643 [Lomentospora prolificans]
MSLAATPLSANNEFDRDVFGILIDVPDESLIQLALTTGDKAVKPTPRQWETRRRYTDHPSPCYRLRTRINLSRCRSRHARISGRYSALHSRTYTRTNSDTEDIWPRHISSVWFDDYGTLPRGELRLRILRSLSASVTQSCRLHLNKIASMTIDQSKNAEQGQQLEAFDTSVDYLKSQMAPKDTINLFVYRIFNPKPRLGLALCALAFDSQNVMVDDGGPGTGIMD